MNAMSDFQIVVLLPLLSLGMACIFCQAYNWCREHLGNKERLKEDGYIAIFVSAAVLFGIFNMVWFIPQLVTGDVVKWVVDTQDDNCRETTTKDGEQLTDDQCEYFEDVLNGKYNEYGQRLNIRGYLGFD